MEEKRRKAGTMIIGDVPWGTHICQFYRTQEDLLDILVPYFKAGLENNEFCMWITSEPLKVEDAKAALKKVVKNLDHFINKGQIEILDYSEWYTKSGKFDANNVLQGWVEKENQALKRGYDGLRLSGNTFWLGKRDWRNFTDYEEEANKVIGKYRMIAICNYSLDKCGASEVTDVVSNHQFILIRQEGEWVIIENSKQKQAEGKYTTILKTAMDGFWITDMQGRFLDINDAYCRLIGYDRNELLNMRISDVEAAERPEETVQHIKKITEVDGDRFETRHRCKDGRIVDVEISVNYIDAGGGRLFVFARDITERKHAEDALRFTRFSLDNSADTMVCVDHDGRFIDVNDACWRSWGYSREELLSMTVHDIDPDYSAEIWPEFWEKLKQSGSLTFESCHRSKEGRIFPVEITANYLEYNGKEYHCSFARDITERKRAEEALRETEELYRTVLKTSPDGISINDMEGRITFVSERVLGLFGLIGP